MKYADDRKIPFVAIIGDKEMSEGKFMLKNMETGTQNLVDLVELINEVKKLK